MILSTWSSLNRKPVDASTTSCKTIGQTMTSDDITVGGSYRRTVASAAELHMLLRLIPAVPPSISISFGRTAMRVSVAAGGEWSLIGTTSCAGITRIDAPHNVAAARTRRPLMHHVCRVVSILCEGNDASLFDRTQYPSIYLQCHPMISSTLRV